MSRKSIGCSRVRVGREYDGQLTKLGRNSQGAQREIEPISTADRGSQPRDQTAAGAHHQRPERQRWPRQQEGDADRRAIAAQGRTARARRRPAEKKTELDNRAKGVDAKRVEAQAEDRGAEGTLKQGKGPSIASSMGDMHRLQEAYKIQEERVRDSPEAADCYRCANRRTRARIRGRRRRLAKLKGEAANRRAAHQDDGMTRASARTSRVSIRHAFCRLSRRPASSSGRSRRGRSLPCCTSSAASSTAL